MFKLNFVLILIICFAACNTDKPIEHNQKIDSIDKAAPIRPVMPIGKKSAQQPQILTDTITFIEYDDNGDYPLLFAKKGNKRLTFIYNTEAKINFVRDDQLLIKWKIDSTWISGEGEKLEMREWITQAKKIKDGSVSLYRKQHHKPIKYWYEREDSYSATFKDYLYTWVEYYLANTKNKLVLANLKADVGLSYSIEDGNRNGRAYTILGLSNNAENHSSIMVWLYLDNETRKFYEYDLANDKLVEFR